MSLFDHLVDNAATIAEKTNISSDKVRSISSSLRAKIAAGCGHAEAMKAAAGENGISVDKIQEVLDHAGGSSALMGDIGGLMGGLIKRPDLP